MALSLLQQTQINLYFPAKLSINSYCFSYIKISVFLHLNIIDKRAFLCKASQYSSKCLNRLKGYILIEVGSIFLVIFFWFKSVKLCS